MSELQSKKKDESNEEGGEGQGSDRDWWGEILTEGAEAVQSSWASGTSSLVFWENSGAHLHVSLLSQLLAGLWAEHQSGGHGWTSQEKFSFE